MKPGAKILIERVQAALLRHELLHLNVLALFVYLQPQPLALELKEDRHPKYWVAAHLFPTSHGFEGRIFMKAESNSSSGTHCKTHRRILYMRTA